MIYFLYQFKMDVIVEALFNQHNPKIHIFSRNRRNTNSFTLTLATMSRYLQKWLFFLDCVVLEMLLFNNSNSYHGSQSFTVKSQTSRLMSLHSLVRSAGHELSAHAVRVKRPISSRCLAWRPTIVNKNSFESSKADLFTSNTANKTEARLP